MNDGESVREPAAAAGSRVVAVVGATAAGKSEVAVRLAERLDGEIVSADAMQVYRGLDIGTAKVGPEARERVPHHGLDLIDPDDSFSAGDYARWARRAVAGIEERRRLPIVVGGSGFYLRALFEGLAPLPRQSSRWRRALETVEARRGLEHLDRMLRRLDPDWAERIGPNDRQRILRALEVTLRIGKPFSRALRERKAHAPGYRVAWVGLDRSREELRQRIVARVDRMLEAGWIDEVRALLEAGVPRDARSLRAIGYRELAEVLAGTIDLAEARQRIITATYRYAKRQLTWFRGQAPVRWFGVRGDDLAPAVEQIEAHLRGWLQGDDPVA